MFEPFQPFSAIDRIASASWGIGSVLLTKMGCGIIGDFVESSPRAIAQPFRQKVA